MKTNFETKCRLLSQKKTQRFNKKIAADRKGGRHHRLLWGKGKREKKRQYRERKKREKEVQDLGL